MIDKHFSKVLYFPPRFARLETYLEDSSGQRWRVGICNRNGSLAIQQGWHTFSSEHGLKLGNFLVFHYIQGQHFVVQIYGTSGCEKINFYNGTRMGKKRPRTSSAATSHDDLSPETNTNLRNNRNSSPLVTAVPESERAGHQPVTTTFASQFERPRTNSTATSHNELSPKTDISLRKNGNSTPSVIVVPESERARHQPMTTTFSSQFGKRIRVDKQEWKETAAKTRCPPKMLNGKEPKITEKDGQGYPEAIIGINQALKRKPADSGDIPFPNAVNFACSLQLDDRNFLELPQFWPQVLKGQEEDGKDYYISQRTR